MGDASMPVAMPRGVIRRREARAAIYLPDELWLHIMRSVDDKRDIIALRAVSRQLQRVAFTIRQERYPSEKRWYEQHELSLDARWIFQNLDQVRLDADWLLPIRIPLNAKSMSAAAVQDLDAAMSLSDTVADIHIFTSSIPEDHHFIYSSGSSRPPIEMRIRDKDTLTSYSTAGTPLCFT